MRKTLLCLHHHHPEVDPVEAAVAEAAWEALGLLVAEAVQEAE